MEYYLCLQMQLKGILKEKCGGKFIKVVLNLHGNAPNHRSLTTQKKLAYLGFDYLYHPPYSPDPAPSNYHLLTGQKKIESSSDVVIAAAETGLDRQYCELFLSVLQEIEQRAKKCIELRGECVTQIPSLFAEACFLPGRAKVLSAIPPISINW